MKTELQILEEFSDEARLAEPRRVAEAMIGQRLAIERFSSLARVLSTLCAIDSGHGSPFSTKRVSFQHG
jgi:hypothetical protein